MDGDGVTPIPFGSVPAAGAALNRTYLSVAELAIRAAAERPAAGPPGRPRGREREFVAHPRADLGAVRRSHLTHAR